MVNALAGGIYVIAATKDGKREYWAAATIREEAVASVQRELPPGWIATITDRRLTPQTIKSFSKCGPIVCESCKKAS